jgi:hypothetical protein
MTTTKIMLDNQTIEVKGSCFWATIYKTAEIDSSKKTIVRKSDGLPISALHDFAKHELKTVDYFIDTAEVRITRLDDEPTRVNVKKVDHLSADVTSLMEYNKMSYNKLHSEKKIVSSSVYGGFIESWWIFIPISRLSDDDESLIHDIDKVGCNFCCSSKIILERAREI